MHQNTKLDFEYFRKSNRLYRLSHKLPIRVKDRMELIMKYCHLTFIVDSKIYRKCLIHFDGIETLGHNKCH